MENIAPVKEMDPMASVRSSAESGNSHSLPPPAPSSCGSASAAVGPSERPHRRRLSLAKKRASTLLKDADFCLKYPSVAKALVELLSSSPLSSATSEVAVSSSHIAWSSAVTGANQGSPPPAVVMMPEVFGSPRKPSATSVPCATSAISAAVPESAPSPHAVSPGAACGRARLRLSGQLNCVAACQSSEVNSAGHFLRGTSPTNTARVTAAAGGIAATGTAARAALQNVPGAGMPGGNSWCPAMPPQCVSREVTGYPVATAVTGGAGMTTPIYSTNDKDRQVILDNQVMPSSVRASSYPSSAVPLPPPGRQLPTAGLAATEAPNSAAPTGVLCFKAASPPSAPTASFGGVTTRGMIMATPAAATRPGAVAVLSGVALHDVQPGGIDPHSPLTTKHQAAGSRAGNSGPLNSSGCLNKLQTSTYYPTHRPPLSSCLPRAPVSCLSSPFSHSSDAFFFPAHFPLPVSSSSSHTGSQRSADSQHSTTLYPAVSANGIGATAAAGGECNLLTGPRAQVPDLRQLLHTRDDSDGRRLRSSSFASSIGTLPAAQQFVHSVCVRATPPSSVRRSASAEGGDMELLQRLHHLRQRAEKVDAACRGQSPLQLQPQQEHETQSGHEDKQSEHPQQRGTTGNSAKENGSAAQEEAVVTEPPASQYIPPGIHYRSRLFTSSPAGATNRAEDVEAFHGDDAGEKGGQEKQKGDVAASGPQYNHEAEPQPEETADVDGLPEQSSNSGRTTPVEAVTGTPTLANAVSASIPRHIPGPPQHFANRFEELRRRYEAALHAANTVEYQYRLFRSLDRSQPRLHDAALRFYPFLPSTPRPGTLVAAARGASCPPLGLYQKQNTAEGIAASAPPQRHPAARGFAATYHARFPAGDSLATGAVTTPGGYRPREARETAAAAKFAQTEWEPGQPQVIRGHLPASSAPAAPPLSQQQKENLVQKQAAEAARAAGGPESSACIRDWKGFGPVVKEGMVNPAIVMEKQLMDEALCHMRYESVALQQQSRELQLRLTDHQQEAQDKLWRRVGVREALCDISQEQRAFLKEQLRALDQTRGDLQMMQEEAARMERRARDMFYRKLYTSAGGGEDEEVKWHRQQMKTLEQLRQQLPSTAALEATISHFISSCSSTSGLLNRLEECGLATAAEHLSPDACGKAVDDLLKRMGYEEQSAPVPVRRGDGLPAQYYSRFPELYPHPEFQEALPHSQQAVRERLQGLEAKGEPTNFTEAVIQHKRQHGRADVFLSTAGTKPSVGANKEELVWQQKLQQQQQQKEQLDQDWQEFFRLKREAREIEQAQRAAEQARQDAVKAVEEAQQAVELLARRQRVMESEAAAAERKAAAERDAAAAAERRAEAEKQAAEEAAAAAAAAEELLRQQRMRRAEQKAAEEEERQRQASRLKETGRSATREASAAGGAWRGREEHGGEARRLYSRRTETRELGGHIHSKRNTLTVEAAEGLAQEMKRKESIVSGVPSAVRGRSPTEATVHAGREPHGRAAGRREREDIAGAGATETAAGLTAGDTGNRRREEIRGRAMERQPSQYLGVQRTLTMHKTPLSRSLSASVAPDAERLLLDTTAEQQTVDDQEEIKGIQPPDRLLLSASSKRFAVYAHVQRREKTELIGNSPFAKRLPYNKCEIFVLLEPPDSHRLQRVSLYERYKEVKGLLASSQLGLKENAQDVYDFAVSCCHRSIRADPRSQEYANVLMEAIPYYPYQIDIQRAGIIALLNIFEHCKYQEQLAVPLFECLTTLLAIEDAELRGDIVAVMAAAIRPQVSVNSEVVDLLLQLLQASADAAVCCYCLHVLLVGRSPHHKEKQYSLFVRLLEKWKFDPVVPTRACLAVDAFARRAVQEELAAHERRKREYSSQLPQPLQQRQQQWDFPAAGEGAGENLSYGLDLYRRGSSFPIEAQVLENVKPPAWMTPSREDVEKIVLVMERHPQHRRLQGAASQALASLAAVSLSHSEAIAEKGFSEMKTAALNHKESQTIADSLCSLVALLAALPSCHHVLQADDVDIARQLLVRHRAVAEVVASACAALAKLDALYSLSDENLDRVTLAIVLNNLRNAADQPAIAASIAELLQRVAPRYEELAGARKRLVELNAVEAILKATTACSSSVQELVDGRRVCRPFVAPGEQHRFTFSPVVTTLSFSFVAASLPSESSTSPQQATKNENPSSTGFLEFVCEVTCKAISHLVFHQEDSSEVYVQLVKYRAITSFLFILLKHHRCASFCREALSCIANCCVHAQCAEAIMERGLNVICKAMSANIKDMEVVAQGCRCLRCISRQPALQDLVSHRAASIISFAAEQFSSRLDTRALVAEFLTDILHGRGVRPQTLDPLWSGAAAAVRSSAAAAAH